MSKLILDSEAVTGLAKRDKRRAARLDSLKRRNLWPPVVPSVVLAECVSGRQSVDARTNRFLKDCDIDEVLPEHTARTAGRLQLEAVVDTDTGAVAAVTVQITDGGDCASLPVTLDEAERNLAQVSAAPKRWSSTPPPSTCR